MLIDENVANGEEILLETINVANWCRILPEALKCLREKKKYCHWSKRIPATLVCYQATNNVARWREIIIEKKLEKDRHIANRQKWCWDRNVAETEMLLGNGNVAKWWKYCQETEMVKKNVKCC